MIGIGKLCKPLLSGSSFRKYFLKILFWKNLVFNIFISVLGQGFKQLELFKLFGGEKVMHEDLETTSFHYPNVCVRT